MKLWLNFNVGWKMKSIKFTRNLKKILSCIKIKIWDKMKKVILRSIRKSKNWPIVFWTLQKKDCKIEEKDKE